MIVAYMRWGLIPSWAKSASVGSRMINARAETVAERPSFRPALQRRRRLVLAGCLVLADGFYAWERKGSGRRPMRVVMASGDPFAFAGLWDAWWDPKGEIVCSCAIITTSANELLSPSHDRMPVILPRKLESFWLDHDIQDPAFAGILTPYSTDAMAAYEVSFLVNRPANDGPELVVPVREAGPDSEGSALKLPLCGRRRDDCRGGLESYSGATKGCDSGGRRSRSHSNRNARSNLVLRTVPPGPSENARTGH